MKALILNSGIGQRMGELTSNHPKCMTRISENDTILSRQLMQLERTGIKEVIITTGLFNQVLEDFGADTINLYDMKSKKCSSGCGSTKIGLFYMGNDDRQYQSKSSIGTSLSSASQV